jgi:LPS export ABC transporter protein LptC
MAFFIFTMIRIFFIASVVALSGCTKTEFKETVEYTGPLREAENVEFFNSENDRVNSKMKAKTYHEFANGDKEFPDGVYIEMYDESGTLESTLRANHAKYFAEEKHWRGQGKVEVKNVLKNEQLNTEELFWNPTTKKIYTDKFVTIRLQGDVVYGEGLEANQDLSDYVIAKPKGEFEVSE